MLLYKMVLVSLGKHNRGSIVWKTKSKAPILSSLDDDNDKPKSALTAIPETMAPVITENQSGGSISKANKKKLIDKFQSINLHSDNKLKKFLKIKL